MKALVLEEVNKLAIKDVPDVDQIGCDDVKIKIKTVGICGSDVHYYTHGRIGDFIVEKPMILGHEAAGVVVAVGENVTNLALGDRVCMEPGIPCAQSTETMQGIYNLDPAVKFWATPPYDGCCCENVVHPAAFTFKLPENVSFAEGAMVEPLAIGMHAATKASIKPGDIALVYGAGTIGVVTALAALAGGCSEVIIVDVVSEKLEVLSQYAGITAINSRLHNVKEYIMDKTYGRGVDVVFECCGNEFVISNVCECVAPAGCVVLVGMPLDKVKFDVVAAQVKEVTFKTIFRYANMYPKTIAQIASGKINVKPLISKTYAFADSIKAYERAAAANPHDVKLMLEME